MTQLHNAYLGNRLHDPGEQIGDMVLVASRPYVTGWVLVFGDTSPFQNGALVTSHLFVARRRAEDLEFEATVELAEISGSETFIHVTHGGVSWVVQEEGVHSFALGERLRVFVDPGHLFAFDHDGRLVAAPRRRAFSSAAA